MLLVQGIHLIRHAVYRTVEQGGQFVLLGSGHTDGDFRAMAAVRAVQTRWIAIEARILWTLDYV